MSVGLAVGLAPLPPAGTPSAVCFLDETGVVAQDRFFAVGVLTLNECSDLPTQMRKLRQRRQFFGEWHFNQLETSTYRIYQEFVDLLVADSNWTYQLVLADRDKCDVAAECGDRYVAYERISAQTIAESLPSDAQVAVLADEYTTPDAVRFEESVRWDVNVKFGGNVVAAVVRVTSTSHDLLQASDVLTGAVVYKRRAAAGLAGGKWKRPTPKARMSRYVESTLGTRLAQAEFDPMWLQVPARV